MLNLRAQVQNSSRYKDWIAVAQNFSIFLGQEAEIQLQGLGRLDLELIWADANAAMLGQSKDPLEATLWSDMSYRLTLSRLWVLGAYELVRILNEGQRLQPLEGEARQNVARVKSNFDRIRMPLAKLEAAKKHRGTDFSVAHPIVHRSEGIGWLLSPDNFMTRRMLADSVIGLATVLATPSVWPDGVHELTAPS